MSVSLISSFILLWLFVFLVVDMSTRSSSGEVVRFFFGIILLIAYSLLLIGLELLAAAVVISYVGVMLILYLLIINLNFPTQRSFKIQNQVAWVPQIFMFLVLSAIFFAGDAPLRVVGGGRLTPLIWWEGGHDLSSAGGSIVITLHTILFRVFALEGVLLNIAIIAFFAVTLLILKSLSASLNLKLQYPLVSSSLRPKRQWRRSSSSQKRD